MDWVIAGMNIDHCLVRKTEPHCKLQVSSHILVIVMICNTIKIMSMLWALFYQMEVSFVTFEDAISSWLDDPDDATKGRCLASRREILDLGEGRISWAPRSKEGGYFSPAERPDLVLLPTTFDYAPACHWWHAVSSRRWKATVWLCVSALVAVGVILSLDASSLGDHIASLGFGAVHPSTMLRLGSSGSRIAIFIGCALCANLAQIVSSFLYLAYNGLFTCMHMAHEYSDYAVRRKPLRVTDPKEHQRTTYWLQLPFSYAIPLTLASKILHWLISQSVFVADVSIWSDGVEMENQNVTAIGYSYAPMIGVLVLGGLLLLALASVLDMKLPYHMPVAGSCSFALAAHCHRPEGDVDAAVLLVKWGVVSASSGEHDIGHCSFTSKEVTEMQEGRRYA
jgi:hypothetical protein